MTIDDENSIYVGGLPYDATEDDLRRAFEIFGAIVAVKMIDDREIGGKCYGFVTFTNPRCAKEAINDMNSRTIGGRVIRVNDVKARGGRPSFHHENFRRAGGKDIDWERDRDRDRDIRDIDRDRDRGLHDRDRFQDRNIERSRDRDRGRDYERGRDLDHARDHAFGRGRHRSFRYQEHARDHDEDLETDRDMDLDQERLMDKTLHHDLGREEQQSRNIPGSHPDDRPSRELSVSSSDGDQHQVKEELDISIHRCVELQKELEMMDGSIYEHVNRVSDLERKSQELEDALAAARKLSSQRRSMLAKLHRCFMQSQDYSERLKSSEQELKLLVDASMAEVDTGDEMGTGDGSAYANGQS